MLHNPYLVDGVLTMDVLVRASDCLFWEAIILPWKAAWQRRQQAIFTHASKIPIGPPDCDIWGGADFGRLHENVAEVLLEKGIEPHFVYLPDGVDIEGYHPYIIAVLHEANTEMAMDLASRLL